MVVLSIFSGIFFYVNNTQAFFFIGIYFFYFISNNNCRLLTINIVSFIFLLLSGIHAATLFTLGKKVVQWTGLLWHCEYSLTCSFKGGEHGYSDTVSTVWHTRSKAVNMVTLTLWVQSDILVQRRWTWLLWYCEYSLTYSFKGDEHGYWDTVNTVWHTRSKED